MQTMMRNNLSVSLKVCKVCRFKILGRCWLLLPKLKNLPGEKTKAIHLLGSGIRSM